MAPLTISIVEQVPLTLCDSPRPTYNRCMKIRPAQPEDSEAIVVLLDQLGYPGTGKFLCERIKTLAAYPGEVLVVGEESGCVIAVMSMSILPQLATPGPFAQINYLCVLQEFRSSGLGRQLEEYAVTAAEARGCGWIVLHSHSRRTDAHRFYIRQGYEESPKYFVKKL